MMRKVIKKLFTDDMIVKMKNLSYKSKLSSMVIKNTEIHSYELNKFPQGINLIGDIKSETGLGQSMRIIAAMLRQTEVSFMIKQVNSSSEAVKQFYQEWDKYIENKVIYGINIIHINMNIWIEKYLEMDNSILDYRYNIAYWLWELEEFPEEWIPYLDTIDEIWTPSDFISDSIRKRTNKPVHTIPYHITLDISQIYKRQHFSLNEKLFLFLIMYDHQSNMERKNPQDAVDAYKLAFKPKDNTVGLVIKINHLKYGNEANTIKESLKNYANIYYIEENMSRREVESLINCADVFVSLHRSEGFGLPLAEAMYLGTPVISTNWSATTEFMDEDSACLVDYKMVELKRNTGIYKKGNRWAQPDIYHAAEYMRKLYNDTAFYEKLKQNGKVKIKSCSGLNKIKCRMNQIYEVNNEQNSYN